MPQYQVLSSTLLVHCYIHAHTLLLWGLQDVVFIMVWWTLRKLGCTVWQLKCYDCSALKKLWRIPWIFVASYKRNGELEYLPIQGKVLGSPRTTMEVNSRWVRVVAWRLVVSMGWLVRSWGSGASLYGVWMITWFWIVCGNGSFIRNIKESNKLIQFQGKPPNNYKSSLPHL